MNVSTGDGTYIRAVEAAWAKLRGRPTVLSPRDFETVSGWRKRGIPLSLVLEAIDHRARRRAHAGRSLAGLASEIEESWSVVVSGRATPAPAAAPSGSPRSCWRDAARTQAGRPALRAVLDELARRSDAGATDAELDAELDLAIARHAPAEMLGSAERETSEALRAFAGRMPPDELARTRARAIADRLRRMLSLPPRLG
jgi:hypothetical protein